jgi:hypothetical protein
MRAAGRLHLCASAGGEASIRRKESVGAGAAERLLLGELDSEVWRSRRRLGMIAMSPFRSRRRGVSSVEAIVRGVRA